MLANFRTATLFQQQWRRRGRLAALIALLLFVPLALGGCAPQVDVPASAEVALQQGQQKIDAAQKAAAQKNNSEAQRLFREAAAYYNAVSRKFQGTSTGAQALLKETDAYSNGAKDNQAALQAIRLSIRQYNEAELPREAEQLQREYARLAQLVNEQNAKTPYYQVMDTLVRLVGGSRILAIVAVSIGITLALWPLRARQYRASKEMMRFAPQLKKLQEKYKDDKGLQQEKVMEFYKEHGVNPFASCLPLLLQMPFLILLYQCIAHYQYQFTRDTFLWINPQQAAASAQWPAPLGNWHLIGHNLGEQDVILLAIYAFSFYLQTKLNPVTDPAQAEQQKVMAVTMPAMSFIMMLQWQLPAAFVLYWFLSNTLSVAQQWWLRRVDPMPTAADTAAITDAMDATPSDDAPRGGSGNGKPKTINGGSGGGAVQKGTLSANPRLISPKNRKPRRSGGR